MRWLRVLLWATSMLWVFIAFITEDMFISCVLLVLAVVFIMVAVVLKFKEKQ